MINQRRSENDLVHPRRCLRLARVRHRQARACGGGYRRYVAGKPTPQPLPTKPDLPAICKQLNEMGVQTTRR